MAVNVLVKIYTESKAKVISMYYLRCTLPTEDAMELGNECISKDIHKNLNKKNKKSSHVLIKVYIFSLDGCGFWKRVSLPRIFLPIHFLEFASDGFGLRQTYKKHQQNCALSSTLTMPLVSNNP